MIFTTSKIILEKTLTRIVRKFIYDLCNTLSVQTLSIICITDVIELIYVYRRQ